MSEFVVANEDLQMAIEEGCFEVETPTTHVDSSQLSNFSLGVSNNPYRNWKNELCKGPRTLNLSFWFEDSLEPPHFHLDLRKYFENGGEDPIVLYGGVKMWYAWDLFDFDLTASYYPSGDKFTGKAEFAWKEVESFGPR